MVRLLHEDVEAISKLAKDSNRTNSNYIDWIVRQHLKELRESRQIDFNQHNIQYNNLECQVYPEYLS